MGLRGTIIAPDLPKSIPAKSKWLSGQGAGTWFYIEETEKKNEYRIQRFTPNGEMDCDRIFEQENKELIFDINQPFEFAHVSHCSKCRIVQNEKIIVFNYTNQ